MDSEDNNKSPYNRTSEWTGDASGINPATSEARVKHDNAAATLGAAENDAASNTTSSQSSDSPTDQATEFENNVQGPSIAKVANRPLSPRLDGPYRPTRGLFNRRTPLKAAGKFRKFAPLGFVGVLLMAGAMLILGAQSLLPFSLGEVLKGAFDTVLVSTTARSHVWFKAQMDPDRTVKPAVKDTIFGNTKFKITDKQKANLKAQGIEVVEDFELSNKKKITVLVVDDGSGNKSIVTPDSKYNEYVQSSRLPKEIRMDTKGSFTTVDLDTKYSTDPNYHSKHNAAFATWRTSVANWYNKRTGNFLKRWGLTRDLFHKFEAGKKTLADIKSEIQNRVKNGDSSTKYKSGETTDSDGNKQAGEEGSDRFSTSDFKDRESARAKVSSMAKNYATKVGKGSGIASTAANGICGIAGFVGAMSLAAAASEAQQFMTLALAYLEAIDKTKQGDGAESPMNELVNTLTEPANVEDIDGNPVRENTTAMQAVGIQSAYGGDVSNAQNDASMNKLNASNMINDVAQNIGTSAAAFTTCMAGKIGTGLIDMGVDTAIAISCIAEIASVVAAPACLGEIGLNWLAGIAIGVGVAVAIEGIAPLVGDLLFDMFKKDVTEYAGEDLGNAIFAGTSTLMGGVARSNGQSLTSGEVYGKFVSVQNDVNAEIAREARETLSPFDISSQYTFLGSIINKIGTASNSSAIASNNILASVARAASNSLTLFSPSASAEPLIAGAPEGTCPELEAIGAVCNISGQPNTITDPDTLEDDPADVTDHISGDLDLSKEVPTVKTDNLIDNNTAKYILFCENRDSAFGSYDQNIADQITELQTGGGGNALTNAAKYSTPVAGNVVSIFEDTTVAQNADYVSGAACVAGSESYYKRNNQYVARYEEDQQMAKSVGLISDTTADIFLEEWYENHPLDDSLEGTIARHTGMRKDDVIALLDTLEEAYELANYDPTNLGPINNTKEDAPTFAGAPEDKQGLLDGIELGEQIAFVADTRGDSTAESNPIVQRTVAVA